MKNIYITNGSAQNGKDTFAQAVSKYIPTYKYSSIDLIKDMLEFAGIPREPKTENKKLEACEMTDAAEEIIEGTSNT